MTEETKKDVKKDVELEEQPELQQPLAITKNLLTEDVIRRAEMQVEGIKKIKVLALRVTNENDWSNQNGKPYLENIGCMKVARLFGVSFRQPQIVMERFNDSKGDYILCTAEGYAEFRGEIISDIGTCSTRDDFFGKKEKELKQIEDVDIENVKKKSVTNLQNRLLKKLLGLSYTWEEINATGLDIEKIKKVQREVVAATADEKKLQVEIGKWLIEMCRGDKEEASESLKSITAFKGRDGKEVPGVATLEALKGIRLQIAHGKVKAYFAEYQKNLAGGGGD